MNEFLSRFGPGQLEGFVILGACLMTGLIVFLSLQWRLHRRTEIEASLKQDMINRGMSADEIERVLKASMRGGRRCRVLQQDSAYAAKIQE
jgi:hypothetical protein